MANLGTIPCEIRYIIYAQLFTTRDFDFDDDRRNTWHFLMQMCRTMHNEISGLLHQCHLFARIPSATSLLARKYMEEGLEHGGQLIPTSSQVASNAISYFNRFKTVTINIGVGSGDYWSQSTYPLAADHYYITVVAPHVNKVRLEFVQLITDCTFYDELINICRTSTGEDYMTARKHLVVYAYVEPDCCFAPREILDDFFHLKRDLKPPSRMVMDSMYEYGVNELNRFPDVYLNPRQLVDAVLCFEAERRRSQWSKPQNLGLLRGHESVDMCG